MISVVRKKEIMIIEKLNIKQILKDSIIVLKKKPIIFVPSFIAILLSIIGTWLKSNSIIKYQTIFTLIGVFFWAVIIRFIYEAKIKSPPWKEILKYATKKYILIIITIGVLAIPFFILGFILPLMQKLLIPIPMVWIIMITIIFTVIFLIIKLYFFIEAILIDNEGIIGSLKTSWEVTKGNWWRIFGIMLIFAIPIAIVEDVIPCNGIPFVAIKILVNLFLYTYMLTSSVFAYLTLRKNIYSSAEKRTN